MEHQPLRLDISSVKILVILAAIEIFINGIAVVFNRATTFCITDVMIVESSRFLQIMTIVFCTTKIGLYIWGNQQFMQIILNGLTIFAQISLIIYIILINDPCSCCFLSAIIAIGCCSLTLSLSAAQIFYNVYFIQRDSERINVAIPN